jgi:hypothetical protein
MTISAEGNRHQVEPNLNQSRFVHTRRRNVSACTRSVVATALLAGTAVSVPPTRAGHTASRAVSSQSSAAALAASLPPMRPGYPLLASYNGFTSAGDIAAYAYQNLVVAKQNADRGTPSPLALLRRANPRVTTLIYQRTIQVDYPLIATVYGTAAIYPGWWLLRAGSWLAAPINATQRWIPVLDVSRFHLFDDVLVDGESMHVTGTSGSSLIVTRGFFSKAAPHAGHAKIAAHYSYRVDLANSIISGKGENRRPWSFNLSTLCPRDPAGHTWTDFLTTFLADHLRTGNWSGVFFDNTDESLRDPNVDVNGDNMPDGGLLGGRNVWHAGEVAMLARMHALAPRALILDNGTLDGRPLSNGREFENFPLYGANYYASMAAYERWTNMVAAPRFLMVNPDTQLRPHFDLRAMRFGLASALMGDGYYLYDEGWHRHGAAWNFDEYDDGAGTALLQDTSPDTSYLRVRSTSKFHIGDLLTVGRELMIVRDLGTWNLVVDRGAYGTVPDTHLAGSIVATPSQIAAGSGYLGMPISPPMALHPGAGVRWTAPRAMIRYFEHGVVLLNPAAGMVHVRLPHVYWRLRGDQDQAVNSGQPVQGLSMAPYTGLILLNAPAS